MNTKFYEIDVNNIDIKKMQEAGELIAAGN